MGSGGKSSKEPIKVVLDAVQVLRVFVVPGLVKWLGEFSKIRRG